MSFIVSLAEIPREVARVSSYSGPAKVDTDAAERLSTSAGHCRAQRRAARQGTQRCAREGD